ncbi:hypothetical protein Ancab_039009 [Ancistrocladus abbreviatus]
MKERLTYMVLDYSEPITLRESSMLDKPDKLPDGQVMTIRAGRFRCPQVLFFPNMLGMNAGRVHDSLSNVMRRFNTGIRRDLYANVVLSGGNTTVPDFADQLMKKLRPKVSPSMRVKVIAPLERKYNIWIASWLL